MLTFMYQALLAVVILLITADMFSQKSIPAQMTAAVALVPFALRLFMIG